MSEGGTDRSEGITTCPECGDPMYADEEWQITDRSKIGEPVGKSIEGDYAHARCMDSGRDV